jgi:hypothetical protein
MKTARATTEASVMDALTAGTCGERVVDEGEQ